MAPPARKKSRLTSNENETEIAPAHERLPDDEFGAHTIADSPITSSQLDPPAKRQQKTRSSWYSTSSWQTKASPVAQVARESISVDKGVSSESSDRDAQRRPSQSVSKSSRGSSRKTFPLAAEPSRIHANTSEVSLPPKQQPKPAAPVAVEKAKSLTADTTFGAQEQQQQVVEEEPSMGDGDSKAETASLRQSSGSWLGWWSRPDGYGSDGEKVKSTTKAQQDGVPDQSDMPPKDVKRTHDSVKVEQPCDAGNKVSSSQVQPEMNMNSTGSKSWFGLWSRAQNEQAQQLDHQRHQRRQSGHRPDKPVGVPEIPTNIPVEPDRAAEAISSTAKDAPKYGGNARPKPSGWAFWSQDQPRDEGLHKDGTQKEIGELAVADTPSQSHPEAAQFNQEQEQGRKVDSKNVPLLPRTGRARLESPADCSAGISIVATPVDSRLQTPAISQLQTPVDTPEASPAPVQRGKKPQTKPNIILPTFRLHYPPAPNPGVLERMSQYIASTLRLTGQTPSHCHLHPYVSRSQPKIKRAVAIGIHGFFPGPLFQRVLGQPTGTSIRFANYAAAAIKQWCQDHQSEVKDVEVEKVALEGEGLISDRVSTLWKLLLNWLSHLRQADFVLVACHSQGVPVAIMIVAKLIQLGCLSPHVRLGICAMAGINLGPFLEYKSRLFGGTALELFDFCDSGSKVSVAFMESLEICLRHGVRINFVGSLDDQLVSLESSLHIPLSHPYVTRTVFIDGRLHTSNFLTHLVIFAVKLRNLGISDHGLLREISGPLAGSLVGGDGHSRVYDDPAVYQNAVEFALESTDVSPLTYITPASPEEARKSMEAAERRRSSLAGYPSNMTAANSMRRGSLSSLTLNPPGIAPIIAAFEAPGSAGAPEKNPFVLPWAVRGMLEEEIVKRDSQLQLEVRELVLEFEQWRPTSKALRDVRWRLEGVRSML